MGTLKLNLLVPQQSQDGICREASKQTAPGSKTVKGGTDLLHLLLSGMRWIVGNGNSIKFWTFNWVLDCPFIDVVLPSTRHLINIKG